MLGECTTGRILLPFAVIPDPLTGTERSELGIGKDGMEEVLVSEVLFVSLEDAVFRGCGCP